MSANAMEGATTVTMVAVKYFEGGSIATLDQSSVMKVIRALCVFHYIY